LHLTAANETYGAIRGAADHPELHDRINENISIMFAASCRRVIHSAFTTLSLV
jgi:hypothetical protein